MTADYDKNTTSNASEAGINIKCTGNDCAVKVTTYDLNGAACNSEDGYYNARSPSNECNYIQFGDQGSPVTVETCIKTKRGNHVYSAKLVCTEFGFSAIFPLLCDLCFTFVLCLQYGLRGVQTLPE